MRVSGCDAAVGAASPREPAISMPISSALVSLHRLGRRQPALRDHGEPVADLEQLVELLGDDQHRAAARRAGRSAPGGSAPRRRRRRPRSAARRSAPSAAGAISRPTMNFCRLPPDRLRAAASGPPALTLKRRDRLRAYARTRLAADQAVRDRARVRACVSSALSASDISGTAPRPSRSSGTKCRPSARRCARAERAGRRRRRA